MSNLPTRLQRVGMSVSLCILISGTAAGCAFNKGGTPVATNAPATTAFSKAAVLAAGLASLGHASGPINGTMKVGSETRTLSGTVTLNGKASQINLVESGQSDVTLNEILIANHRYTSPDGKIWIDRGTKAAGTSLAAVLAAADTKFDAGVSTVDGVKAHQILTAPDKVDVAPALGIDTWTFDNETTILRVWADDAGKPLGFGASMSWQVTIGGEKQDVSADLDVMFTYTSPSDITAPATPWQWIQDNDAGIAFGLPKSWGKRSSSAKLTLYSLQGTKSDLGYSHVDGGNESIEQAAQDVARGLSGNTSSPESISLASERAMRLTNDNTKAGMYLVEVIVIHETIGYVVATAGSRDDKPAVDTLADQIFSTVEFTR